MNEIINVIKDVSTILTPLTTIAAVILGAKYTKNNFSSQEMMKLKSGKMNEVVDDLLKSGNMSISEFVQTKNFLEIAKRADEHYAKNPKTPDYSNFDLDWYMRFYETVGNISDEQMKDTWARVLAQETDESHSISYKTIDVLKNISRQDAELFAKICRYSIRTSTESTILPYYDKYLNDANISFGEIVTLNELGLISADPQRTITMNYINDDQFHLYTDDKVMIIKRINNNENKHVINVFNFTRAGRELSRIVDDFGVDVLWDVVKSDIIKPGTNPNIKLSLHKINSIKEDGTINFQPNNIG